MELADLETGSLGKLIANDEGIMSSISLSPDGLTMAFQIDASTVKLVETRNWRTRFTLGTDEDASSNNASLRRFMVTVNSVPAVTFLTDEKMVAGEIENGGIKLWDTRTGETRKTLAVDAATGAMAAISANGMIVEVASDETVRLWSINGEGNKTIPSNNQRVSAVALAAEVGTLAIAYENSIVLIGTENLETKRTLAEVKDIASLVLSRDGHLLAGAGPDGMIRIWDTEAGRVKTTLGAGAEISALQFAADGGLLAVAHKNGSVSVWSVERGELGFEAKKHEGAVNAIAFSRDGKLMATGGDDRAAIIWDMQSRKSVRTLKGHDLVVSSLAFSPNGEMLAVGSGNASVVLWNVANGKLNRVMK
jgi:WD40 repeat protein